MEKFALIFPGQGAQYVGMGKEICAEFPIAAETFNQAAEVLGFDLKDICFNGPAEKLTESAICQPAILTLSIAACRVFQDQFKNITASACAGLSLGEYSALVACGSLGFADAVALVNKRGQFMDEASKANPGTLICVMGLDLEKTMAVCAQTQAEIANLNCPGQIVISGTYAIIEKATELALASGAKRVIKLDVSGPFHSSLMNTAAEKLRPEIEKVRINPPQIPFLPNVSADYENNPEKIRTLLIKQVAHTTYWEKAILKAKSSGINDYIEIGPGKVLRGLLQRIDKSLQVLNLEKGADLALIKDKTGGKS